MQTLPKLAEIASDIFVPSITVEYPGYPYITARIKKSLKARNVYWHLVDPEFSLLELGFEWSSSRLTHISVPLFRGRVETLTNPVTVPQRGEPLFDLTELGFSSDWNKSTPEVVKRDGRIALRRSDADLDILLEQGEVTQTVQSQSHIVYGFDSCARLSLIRLLNQSNAIPEGITEGRPATKG